MHQGYVSIRAAFASRQCHHGQCHHGLSWQPGHCHHGFEGNAFMSKAQLCTVLHPSVSSCSNTRRK
eukprot:scaffold50856_cov21-Tisochrysis_lutea.AAC.1